MLVTAFTFVLIATSIFLTLFYLFVYYNSEEADVESLEEYPKVSVLVPAYNEQNSIEAALENLLSLEYPSLEVIFVDDGSDDDTLNKARKFSGNSRLEIVAEEVNSGKAAALNSGLGRASGKFVAVVDGDSEVSEAAIRRGAAKLELDETLGAVICRIKPLNQDIFVRRLQEVEYRMSNFYRNLMSRIDTLDVTPGAFSIYRKNQIEGLGGFDEGNITEDLEMALRLRRNGMSLGMVYDATSKTEMPESFRQLYDQRVRWARGRLVNMWRYRKMFLNRDFGWFGMFQMPFLLIVPIVAVSSLVMASLGIGEGVYNMWLNYTAVGLTFPKFDFNVVRTLLGLNLKIYTPLVASLVVVAAMISRAYEESGSEVENRFALTFYFFLYFVPKAVFWASAILKEALRTDRIWK